jgi:NAD(P)-dependent dehydrogenase (short-subunit alcohol dehydrogenase family)|tara:strand:+ start:96 stop:1001 length:906 start_codon:yes stop_codon:yes gene_type:complete
MSQVSFENRTVIVTGAGNGLGKAYALDLGSRGAKVVVNDLGGAVDGSGSGSTPADEVVNEIIANGGEAVANYDSVATKEGGASIVQTAIDNFGTVDAVVNNAGILRDKSFAKMEEEDLNAIIDVHLKGTFFVCQPAFIQMKEQGYGRFVNVSSPSGLFGNFGQLNYGAAKMGIVGLTNVLAIEGAKYNIKANVIAPNAATRMTEELFGEDMSKLLTVDNITPLVVYLASEQCEVTHEIFSAGGGRFARIGISTDVGYFNASAKAEDIFANIGEIRDLSNPIYPTSLADELPLFNEALNKGN